MSIMRSKRTENFTVLNNNLINDEMLDWKDLGLLVFLLSKPDNWSINAEHLAKVKSMGVKGIYTGLKAICDAGYASKKPNPKGGWDWVIYDEPQNHRKPQNKPNADFGNAENRNSENRRLINTDNKQRLNNEQINIYVDSSDNEKLKIPKPDKKPKKTTIEQSLMFDEFYSVYPRKEAKQAAIAAWEKIPIDLRESVIQDVIKRKINHQGWLKDNGQFIPLPASYLNGKRWNDEITPVSNQSSEARNGKPRRFQISDITDVGW